MLHITNPALSSSLPNAHPSVAVCPLYTIQCTRCHAVLLHDVPRITAPGFALIAVHLTLQHHSILAANAQAGELLRCVSVRESSNE